MRLLLVEDDPTLGSAVRDYLQRDVYAVDWVDTVAGARNAAAACDYELVVLDLGLPDGDGLALLPHFRARPAPPAVIVLTARDRLSDRIRGLDAGADDYVVKPFDLPELAARLRALVRRNAGRHSPVIELGDLTIDPVTRDVRLGDEAVALTPQEYALVVAFAERPRRVLTRRELEDAIHTFDSTATSNVIEVIVSRLRRKLGRDVIETLRGIGYRWGRATLTPGVPAPADDRADGASPSP